MNLSTIVVPEEEARAKVAEYESVVREERSAEDEAIAQAYRAAARGLPVIRLSEAIAAAGFFEDTALPRLAIARPDWPGVHVRWAWHGGDYQLTYSDGSARDRGALVGQYAVRVPLEMPTGHRRSAAAPIPLVPPYCRPRKPRWWKCHILWEVEEWRDEPARDPALIRHLRGDLWTVLAVWDLTELERAVLTQRST